MRRMFLCMTLAIGSLCYSQYYGKHRIQDLIEEANKGNEVAQCFLGDAYYKGKGISQDFEQAFYWWSKASAGKIKLASAKSEWGLGNIYYYGNGRPINYKNAVFYWKKSAEKGDKYAQNDLATCYYKGLGAKQSLVDAAYWFKKSCENGYQEACSNLRSYIKLK
ncbi:hypothetical protein CMU40_00550 [Elizabethkingia anophelis]|nr:hypothetical protein [Elizabethkingia anophelis]MDV3729831.1 hypothetical protein [Elizabethkingia anophelis]